MARPPCPCCRCRPVGDTRSRKPSSDGSSPRACGLDGVVSAMEPSSLREVLEAALGLGGVLGLERGLAVRSSTSDQVRSTASGHGDLCFLALASERVQLAGTARGAFAARSRGLPRSRRGRSSASKVRRGAASLACGDARSTVVLLMPAREAQRRCGACRRRCADCTSTRKYAMAFFLDPRRARRTSSPLFDDPAGHVDGAKRLFEHARLGVHAIEDRHLLGTDARVLGVA